MQGSCGYGLLPRDRWPYWSVAALSKGNPFFKNSTVEGCGMCFQIQCVTGMDDYHKGERQWSNVLAVGWLVAYLVYCQAAL